MSDNYTYGCPVCHTRGMRIRTVPPKLAPRWQIECGNGHEIEAKPDEVMFALNVTETALAGEGEPA